MSGYRKRTVEFSSADGGQWQLDSASTGGRRPGRRYFPSTNGINFLGGETQPTGRDLDVAIQGQGFFEIQAPDGRIAYTRAGEFSVRADHTLVNGAGERS